MAAISFRFPYSSLLGSVRMVDSSAVMGHDALQQPSWPQAQRGASHRQHDGSQADKVKNHRRRQGRGLPNVPHLVMLFSVSPVMAQHRLGSLEKSRRLSKRLSFTSSFFQLQRLSSERTQVRHRLSDAEQSSVILRFEDQNSLTRSVASFWTPHSARAFLPKATAALGVPTEQRDYLGGWSAQGSDNYSRVAARMISNLQELGRVRQETLSQRWTQPRNWTTTFAQEVTQQKTEQSASKASKVRSRCDHSRNSRN